MGNQPDGEYTQNDYDNCSFNAHGLTLTRHRDILKRMDNVIVELYQDSDGAFHYEFRQFKVPRSRRTVCGLDSRELRHAAWFPVGDPRASHHFNNAHPECRDSLVF